MKRQLALEILRHGRRADEIEANADPDDLATLRDILRDWLTGHKWAEARWPEFEMLVRHANEYKIRKKIRAVS